jgi:hypothetical protein
MTEKMYSIIWDETTKAFNYLYKRGCNCYSNSLPSGWKEAHLLSYLISGADDKMIKHVRGSYPYAQIIFTTDEAIRKEKARLFKKLNPSG